MLSLRRLNLLLSVTMDELRRNGVAPTVILQKYVEVTLPDDEESTESGVGSRFDLITLTRDRAASTKLSNVRFHFRAMLLDILLGLGDLATSDGPRAVMAVLRLLRDLASAATVELSENEASVLLAAARCEQQKRPITVKNISRCDRTVSRLSRKELSAALNRLEEFKVIERGERGFVLRERLVIDYTQ